MPRRRAASKAKLDQFVARTVRLQPQDHLAVGRLWYLLGGDAVGGRQVLVGGGPSRADQDDRAGGPADDSLGHGAREEAAHRPEAAGTEDQQVGVGRGLEQAGHRGVAHESAGDP